MENAIYIATPLQERPLIFAFVIQSLEIVLLEIHS